MRTLELTDEEYEIIKTALIDECYKIEGKLNKIYRENEEIKLQEVKKLFKKIIQKNPCKG